MPPPTGLQIYSPCLRTADCFSSLFSAQQVVLRTVQSLSRTHIQSLGLLFCARAPSHTEPRLRHNGTSVLARVFSAAKRRDDGAACPRQKFYMNSKSHSSAAILFLSFFPSFILSFFLSSFLPFFLSHS